MAITAKQALNARHYLKDGADEALLAHYFDGHREHHIAQLHCASVVECLTEAAKRLGFKLVPIEVAAEPLTAEVSA